jgi:hypothetical protein
VLVGETTHWAARRKAPQFYHATGQAAINHPFDLIVSRFRP